MTARKMRWMAVAAGSVALWCGAAGAIQQVRSLYTAIDLRGCKAIPGEAGQGEARLCAGLPGYPVYVAEGARGTYVSIGPHAERRLAARQTLKAVNSLFHKTGRRTTIEWRFVVREGRTVPYATIVRYYTESATGAGEVLVVTRVTAEEVCHVAYIDALANVNAIMLARRLADTVARAETCPVEPAIQGASGRSPM